MRQPASRTTSHRVDVLLGCGPELTLNVLERAHQTARHIVVVPGTAHPGESWSGVRQILRQCIALVGTDALEVTLNRNPGAARLVLDQWTSRLTDRAEPESAAIGARVESHLTHNWVVQGPAFAAWARILAEILGASHAGLAVPSVNHLDWESLAALKCLFRLPGRAWPPLVVGFDDREAEPQFDSDGINWRVPREYVRETVLSLLARSGTRCCSLEKSGAGSADQEAIPGVLPLALTGDEARAVSLLESRTRLDAAECLPVLRAMEACFRRYAFTAALWLGRELFRRAADVPDEVAARAHAVVALSAHNRQFSSQGNRALGTFIAAHLEAALAHESRPVVRCALLYRLAVAHGRRLGALEAAEQWARQATTEAEAVESGSPRYQLAWAHNIMAYVRIRLKDAHGGRACMATALALVRAAEWRVDRTGLKRASGSNVPGDLALTRSLVVNNLAAAEAHCGDIEGAACRLEEACRLEAAIEGSAKYWALSLINNLRNRHRPDLAQKSARSGLRAAAKDREASLQLMFRLQLADLSCRTGDAGSSARHFAAALRLRATLGPLGADYPDFDLAAAAAFEASRPARAEQLLRSKLDAAAAPSDELAAEVASRLAIVAARRGAQAEAEAWASHASDAAARNGHRHCLVRTATNLGRASRLLDRHEDARALLRWALQLVDTRSSPDGVAAVDELLARVELQRCGALAAEEASRTLLLWPAAITSSAAWGVLPELVGIWRQHAEPLRLGADDALDASLNLLRAASRARADCEAPADFGRRRPKSIRAPLPGGGLPPPGPRTRRAGARSDARAVARLQSSPAQHASP